MGQIEIKLTETETKKVTYFPCTKCGSQNIAFGNCGYSSFNVAWGKCKDCNNEAIIYNCEWNISEEKIVEYWNTRNNPEILLKIYQNKIRELQIMIDELKKAGEK